MMPCVMSEDPPAAVVLLTRLARSAYRGVDEETLGMRLKEFTALSALRDTNGRAQRELGEALLMDPNNLVLLLNTLEQRGQLTRDRDPHDRRRHVVHITDAGRAAVAAAENALGQADRDVLDRLDDQERLTLRHLLAKALGDDSV
jgi:DNA-binding MarR family transcriptional regulator